jgi:hypothetical protein
MIMDHPFGDFLTACLAINLGYLALDRFRYRDGIRKILEQAGSHLEGMPEKYKRDKAWEDLHSTRTTPGPGTKSPFLHFVYQKIFNRSIDRILAFAAVIVSFSVLFLRAGHPKIQLPYEEYITDGAGEVVILFFLLITTAISAFFIVVGRRCVKKVAEVVIENLGHLAKQYKDENQAAAEKMDALVDEMRSGTHGL